MKSLSRILSAAGLALGLALAALPAERAAAACRSSRPRRRPHRRGQGNPGDEERRRDVCQRRSQYRRSRPRTCLLQNNLNYQKDLNEVAVIVAKNLAGREKEIGDGMAKIYANEFTEQELKDLVTFYKTPLGQKLLSTEPTAIQPSMSYMNQWAQSFAEVVNAEFRAEMRKRGKAI